MDIQPEEARADSAAQPIYQAWLATQRSAHKRNYGKRLPVRRIREAGLLDQWRLANDVARWLTLQCGDRRITICVTDSPETNAWALVEGPAQEESTIVVSRRALLALQRLGLLVASAARSLGAASDGLPVLGRALGNQPIDDRTAAAIAQLVMTSALHFLLFHEAAHIVRGHLRASAAGQTPKTYEDLGPERDPPMAPEVVSVHHLRDKHFYSRTIEFDADVQALYWLRKYLDHFDPALVGDELGAESQRVFRLLLDAPDGRRWVTLAAALSFHIGLSADASRMSGLKYASHPSRHERVELAIRSDAAIAFHDGEEPLFLYECVAFAVYMVAIGALSDVPALSDVEKKIQALDERTSAGCLNVAARWLGVELDKEADEWVHNNRLTLMAAMRILNPRLPAHHPPTFKLPPMQWWREQ